MEQILPGPKTKAGGVLAALLSGREITRVDAERELHDHVLNTSISILQRIHGVKIRRKRITVPSYQGAPTSCCQYWIELEEIEWIKNRIGIPQKSRSPHQRPDRSGPYMNRVKISLRVIVWQHLLVQAQMLASKVPETGLTLDKLIVLPLDDLVGVLAFLKQFSAEHRIISYEQFR